MKETIDNQDELSVEHKELLKKIDLAKNELRSLTDGANQYLKDNEEATKKLTSVNSLVKQAEIELAKGNKLYFDKLDEVKDLNSKITDLQLTSESIKNGIKVIEIRSAKAHESHEIILNNVTDAQRLHEGVMSEHKKNLSAVINDIDKATRDRQNVLSGIEEAEKGMEPVRMKLMAIADRKTAIENEIIQTNKQLSLILKGISDAEKRMGDRTKNIEALDKIIVAKKAEIKLFEEKIILITQLDIQIKESEGKLDEIKNHAKIVTLAEEKLENRLAYVNRLIDDAKAKNLLEPKFKL